MALMACRILLYARVAERPSQRAAVSFGPVTTAATAGTEGRAPCLRECAALFFFFFRRICARGNERARSASIFGCARDKNETLEHVNGFGSWSEHIRAVRSASEASAHLRMHSSKNAAQRRAGTDDSGNVTCSRAIPSLLLLSVVTQLPLLPKHVETACLLRETKAVEVI